MAVTGARKKPATYEDLRRVPEHLVAEIFAGELYASLRPGLRHAHAASVFLATHVGAVVVRAEPFDAIDLDLSALWTSARGTTER